MYDLTSFLSTISAGSASFVAILGGLIAQKVIEINNGRTAVEEEIKELKYELDDKNDEVYSLHSWNVSLWIAVSILLIIIVVLIIYIYRHKLFFQA